MKQIVDCVVEISINGGKWVEATSQYHFEYKEEKDCVETNSGVLDFEEAIELVKTGKVPNVRHYNTMFRGRDYITVDILELGLETLHYNAKTLKTFAVRSLYRPVMPTIKTLAEHIDAISFCQFMADNNISYSIGGGK